MSEHPTSDDGRVPAISVIVGAYNHAPFVDDCLDSVRAQSCRDFELIVFDDCSTDDTVDRIRAWSSRTSTPLTLIVNETNLGLCASRNRALAKARGKYVSTLAADDMYEPDKLERHW
jgi:glycosyltransferase involved in cell wall biosynthesis